MAEPISSYATSSNPNESTSESTFGDNNRSRSNSNPKEGGGSTDGSNHCSSNDGSAGVVTVSAASGTGSASSEASLVEPFKKKLKRQAAAAAAAGVGIEMKALVKFPTIQGAIALPIAMGSDPPLSARYTVQSSATLSDYYGYSVSSHYHLKILPPKSWAVVKFMPPVVGDSHAHHTFWLFKASDTRRPRPAVRVDDFDFDAANFDVLTSLRLSVLNPSLYSRVDQLTSPYRDNREKFNNESGLDAVLVMEKLRSLRGGILEYGGGGAFERNATLSMSAVEKSGACPASTQVYQVHGGQRLFVLLDKTDEIVLGRSNIFMYLLKGLAAHFKFEISSLQTSIPTYCN
ncbi:hypothetical protein TeGR_g5025 [Tetraparma gracilis]|uniref:Uncharacterized protein n=1 Tax=Tetraparma gracilis TaxID=2962635 RepID=A0ABQ6MGF8_9STRA|nr:hypothetical protein TeGR_g5025 [Tetraparma gracilis]